MVQLENIFIFSFLMFNEKGNFISEDYFNEKILKFVGVDVDKDGNLITVDIFRSYLTENGIKFFDFISIFDLSKVNKDRLIIDGKINGIHPKMSMPMIGTMELIFELKYCDAPLNVAHLVSF